MRGDPKYAALWAEWSPDQRSNDEHMVHMFVGYISVIVDDEEDQPYHPGGAKDHSFQIGRRMALEHLAQRDG